MRRRHWMRLAWALVLAGAVTFTLLASPALLTTTGDVYLVPGAFWLAVAFCVYYTLLARWWGNPMGRMLVGLDISLAMITFEGAVYEEFGWKPTQDAELRLVAGAVLLAVVVIASRLVLLGALHNWVPRLPWKHRAPRD